jgi:hypothetical protein
MLDSLYRRLEAKANWAVVTLFFAGFMLCAGGFDWRRDALGCEIQLLDGRWLYNPPQVAELFNALGSDKLKTYATTELTLDLVFPFVYSTLLALLIVRLYSAGKAKRLILLPVFGALADLSENFTIACLAFGFDGSPSSFAYLAAIFTFVKKALLIISVLVVIGGAISSLGKNKPPND